MSEHNIRGKRALELLTRLSFRRPSGTNYEKDAANLLFHEIEALGLHPYFETFPIKRNKPVTARFEILEPDYASFQVTGLYDAGTTPESGIESEFYYIENIDEISLANVKNKFVLVNNQPTEKEYELLYQAGITGFMQFTGSIRDTDENSDLDTVRFRDYWSKYGKVPAFQIKIKDALEILKISPAKVKFTLLTEEEHFTSQNIITCFRGLDYPEEEIVISAHYDSTPFSYGAWDNGAGVVQIMEAIRYLKDHPPKRTIRAILFGAEEIGLKGSRAYVEAHEELLSKTLLNINIDVGGSYLGSDMVVITAQKDAEDYLSGLIKEAGYSSDLHSGVMSTDSIHFSDYGVPTIFLGRKPVKGGGYMHTRYDTIDLISDKVLNQEIEFLLFLIHRLDSSKCFPIKKSIPEELQTKIKNYFGAGLSHTK